MTVTLTLVDDEGDHVTDGVEVPLTVAVIVGSVDVPGGQTYPLGHGPVQLLLLKPDMIPYWPAGHGVHAAAPLSEYCPGTHATAVALADPDGHA